MDNEKVLSYEETTKVLDTFYKDSKKFWERELRQRNYDNKYQTTDVIETLTLRDVKGISRNPFEPKGNLLDVAAKKDFISNKEATITTTVDLDFIKE